MSPLPDVLLGRFADPDAVETRELPGPCRCPGSPHAVDTFTFRTELGGNVAEASRVAGWQAGDGELYDNSVANDVTMVKAIKSWTLTSGPICQHPGKPHKAGEPVPITRAIVAELDPDSRDVIIDAISTTYLAFQARREKLPNASGDPSLDTSLKDGSPIPKTRRPSSNTTS